MEPVKGGMLATPPKPVAEVFDKADNSKSYASFAIKFAANHVWKVSFFVLKHFRKRVARCTGTGGIAQRVQTRVPGKDRTLL